MATLVKVSGLKELNAALGDLVTQANSRTAKAALARGLIKAAQPIVDRARELVPVASGHLRNSIVASTKTVKEAGRSAYAAAKREGASDADAVAALRAARATAKAGNDPVIVYVGPGQLPHAHLVEFGSVHNAPQPYLRPAWEQTRDKVLETMKPIIGTEIEKAAQRAATKALKAKG